MDGAYLFSCTSDSVWFVSGPEGFSCILHGDPASQQKPLAGTRRVCRATLHQWRGCINSAPAQLSFGGDEFSWGTSSLQYPWCKGSFKNLLLFAMGQQTQQAHSVGFLLSQVCHLLAQDLCLSVKQGSASTHLAALSDNSDFQPWEKTASAKHEELSDPWRSTAGGAAQQTFHQTRQKLKGE